MSGETKTLRGPQELNGEKPRGQAKDAKGVDILMRLTALQWFTRLFGFLK
jgi:hypothetical protein